jgi:predicted RNA binding protein YcfA (HicA-like mRNA interferase family)
MPSPIPFRKVRKQLEDANWYLAKVAGSHHKFKHRLIAEHQSIPVHNNEVKAYYVREVQKAIAASKAAEEAEDIG